MLRVAEADVERLLTFPKAVDLVRDAYTNFARGTTISPQRMQFGVSNGASFYFMPGHLLDQPTVTLKAARVNASNSKASLPTVLSTVYVYDSNTGAQMAEIEAEWLTAVRTAASTAVATDLLASKSSQVLGIFGSGTEARSHVHALGLVRNFKSVLVFSRDGSKRESFARKACAETGLNVRAVDTPDQVVKESDVIVTATDSPTPVFDGTLVQEGTHVNAIGTAAPNDREVDTELVRRSRVIVDSREQAIATYGDIAIPIQNGVLRGQDLIELGSLLIGESRFVRGPDEVTLFKAGGLAVLDAMVSGYIVNSLNE